MSGCHRYLPAYLFPKQKEKTVAKKKLKLQGMN